MKRKLTMYVWMQPGSLNFVRRIFHAIGFHSFETVGRYTRSGMADGQWWYQRRCSICGKMYETQSV